MNSVNESPTASIKSETEIINQHALNQEQDNKNWNIKRIIYIRYVYKYIFLWFHTKLYIYLSVFLYIYIVRHGKSVWNKIESGGMSGSKILKTGEALSKGFMEAFKKNKIKNGGNYIDSPLCQAGIYECLDLHNFLKINNDEIEFKQKSDDNDTINYSNIYQIPYNDDDKRRKSTKDIYKMRKYDIKCLLGLHDSIVYTSNLRRAIDTSIIGLSARFQKLKDEKLKILSCLQEFGKNFDTHTNTKQHCVPQLSEYTSKVKILNTEYLNNFYQNRIDVNLNNGPKNDKNKVSKFNRMLEFNRIVFEQESNTAIVVGHSKWFQQFSKVFLLSNDKNHISYHKKLYNCGVIGFNLCKVIKNDIDYYGIDPSSLVIIYKGFNE